jgi:hypothetical protein
MKCPKCGYHSFDHLDSCKKCGHGLAEHKAKFNLRGFYFPGHTAANDPEPMAYDEFEEEAVAEDDSVDLGFDFLDEPEDKPGKAFAEISLGDDNQMLSINQPFGVDSETIPADETDSNSNDKPGKGPEFAF